MIASKVKVETGGGLTRKRKFELRVDKTLDYIQSKPNGEPIALAEFQELLNFSTYQTTHQFLKKLERANKIAIESVPGTRVRAYRIIGQGTIITSKKTRWTALELEEMAKDYTWHNPNASIKDFITSLH